MGMVPTLLGKYEASLLYAVIILPPSPCLIKPVDNDYTQRTY